MLTQIFIAGPQTAGNHDTGYKPKPRVLFMHSTLLSQLRSGQNILISDFASYQSVIIPFHKASLITSTNETDDDWAFLYVVPADNVVYCVDGKADGSDRVGLLAEDRNALCIMLNRWLSENGLQTTVELLCLSKIGLLQYDRLITPFDSGIFTIIAINFVIRRCPITFTNSNMNPFRLHLAHLLLQCDGKLIFD